MFICIFAEVLNQININIMKENCIKNIHWYIGKYIKGFHYYNECAYCKKRQLIELD